MIKAIRKSVKIQQLSLIQWLPQVQLGPDLVGIKSMKFGKYAEPVPFYGNHVSNFGTGSEFGTAEPVTRTGSAIPDPIVH